MRLKFRTLVRTISVLALVTIISAGAFAQGRSRGNWRRHDRGRHVGWINGRHRNEDNRRNRRLDINREFRRNRNVERRALRRHRHNERIELHREHGRH